MPRSYANNAYNRSVGRVGMPVGSCVISRGSSGGGGSSSGTSGSGSSYLGSASSAGSGVYSSTGSTRTYVDNSYNRRADRVGLPVGTCVISRNSSGSGSASSTGNGAHSSTGSIRTYVDNSYNRRTERVGMPVGSCVISRNNGNIRGSSAGYSDSYSGFTGVSASTRPKANNPTRSESSNPKMYVDNAHNRKLERVGMPHGFKIETKNVQSKNSSTPQCKYTDNTGINLKDNSAVRVYKDNALNRRLGRVGKPLGTAVYSMKGSPSPTETPTCSRTYADNAFNRRVNRVGKPLGSQPISRKSNRTKKTLEIIDELLKTYEADPVQLDGTPYDIATYYYDDILPDDTPYSDDTVIDHVQHLGTQGYDDEDSAYEEAIYYMKRLLAESKWKDESKMSENPKTSKKIIEDYSGQKINFGEIELGEQIGQGGFGDVYFATWKGTPVAVKKLRVQRISKRRLQHFTDEVLAFCDLDYPNIVKFIGACVVSPDLAIVMEYMQMSLFDAVHIKDTVDFSDEERLSILCQTIGGLQYLHDKNMAHCDLKSQNVLLDYEPGETVVAKITDFGLSMVKNDAETSISQNPRDLVRNVGTPRYSAPEILRGELLSADAMMKADIYSLALIMFEVIFEEEPFYNLNYAQLQKQVGDAGKTPEVPENSEIDGMAEHTMKLCWSFDPLKRPEIKEVADSFKEILKL